MHFGTHPRVYADNVHLKACADALGAARSSLHEFFCITLPRKLDDTQVCRAERSFLGAAVPKRDTVAAIFIYLFEDLAAAGYVSCVV